MVAERMSLILLFQILHCNPPCRDGALAVLYSLASTPELAWAAAKHGGVVYILELMLPLEGSILTLYYIVTVEHMFLYIHYFVQLCMILAVYML
jgi:hypothetical protein